MDQGQTNSRPQISFQPSLHSSFEYYEDATVFFCQHLVPIIANHICSRENLTLIFTLTSLKFLTVTETEVMNITKFWHYAHEFICTSSPLQLMSRQLPTFQSHLLGMHTPKQGFGSSLDSPSLHLCSLGSESFGIHEVILLQSFLTHKSNNPIISIGENNQSTQ